MVARLRKAYGAASSYDRINSDGRARHSVATAAGARRAGKPGKRYGPGGLARSAWKAENRIRPVGNGVNRWIKTRRSS
jgi:hypothetical protein